MKSNMKLAAERLLKIADELEREAADNTYFVCDSCNHTASLSDINGKRKEAGEKFKLAHIANVTVNDSLSCPACAGKMAYVPTDTSQKYYVEAEDGEDIGADIFEPVDEQGKEKTDIAIAPEGEAAPEETPAPEGEIDPSVSEGTPEEAPVEKTETSDYDGNPIAPEGEEPPTPESDTPVMDETPALEDKTDETPAIEDKTDGTPDDEAPATDETPEGDNPVIEETVTDEVSDGNGEVTDEVTDTKKKIEIPKEDVPKFEKMPKEAQDAFWKSVQKYSF